MKNYVLSTYHFSSGTEPDEGNAIDEGPIRRALLDCIALLGVGSPTCELSPVEARAINAMTAGFTVEQFQLAQAVVKRAIAGRYDRNRLWASKSQLAAAVVEQTEGAERLWNRVVAEINDLVTNAEEIRRTALEESNSDRKKLAASETDPRD